MDDLIFTKTVTVRGDLISSFVFKDDEAVQEWLAKYFPTKDLEVRVLPHEPC